MKRGERVVYGDKLLEEKLGRNDLCLLQRQADAEHQQMDFIEERPIIRPLSYAEFLELVLQDRWWFAATARSNG